MRRPNPAALLMLAPTHFLLLAVIALPSIYVFWLSLNESTYGSDLTFVGLDNYVEVLTSPYFWRAALNTLIVVNAIVYVELIIAIGMAALFLGGVRFPKLMFAIVLMPYAISEVVGVLVWKIMLNPGSGVISRSIEAMGLVMPNWSISPPLALGVVTLISIWHHLPFTFLLILSYLTGIDPALEQAGATLGAGAWQRFRHVLLPLLLPGLAITFCLSFVQAFSVFPSAVLLGAPAGPTRVISIAAYQAAFEQYDYSMASAVAMVMGLVQLVIVAAVLGLRGFFYRGSVAAAKG